MSIHSVGTCLLTKIYENNAHFVLYSQVLNIFDLSYKFFTDQFQFVFTDDDFYINE